jgi:hypothetical protein
MCRKSCQREQYNHALRHQRVDFLERLGDLSNFGEVDFFQLLFHLRDHRRFILELLDMLVDLLERAGGLDQIFSIVTRT